MTTASHAFLSTAAPRSSRASCRGVGPPARGRLVLLTVQMMRGDVLRDRRRHLAGNRAPALVVLADRARRHVGRVLETQDRVGAARAGRLELRRLGRAAAGT